MINGVEAKIADKLFFSEVHLNDYENFIEVEDRISGEKQSIIGRYLIIRITLS
jgi:hypothetical protein